MVVIRAAAEIAGHARPDLVTRRVRIVKDQSFRAHQLPRSAEPALWPVVIDESLLQRIDLPVLCQSFYGHDGLAVHPNRELAARIDRLAVQQDGAGAALAAVAADFRTGETQMIAQQFDQRPAVFHFHASLDAIDGEFDLGAWDRSSRRRGMLGCGWLLAFERDHGSGSQACAGSLDE